MFWGFVSQVLVLKVAVLHVVFKPFAPQVEAPGFEFPPGCGSLPQERVYSVIVSQPLLPTLMWVFSYLHNAVFRIFPRGSCSILSHRFTVSTEGGKPRTLLHCHLQLELAAFNLGKKNMIWRTLPLPLFFRVHMCSPKQCIGPTADASCDLNGTWGCHFWRNWHVGKKRWKLWDYAEPSGNGPTHGGSCRQLPDECWEDPGR